MNKPSFATCLNCIDGRTHIPVINWITANYPVDYVDLITEPGMAGVVGGSPKPLKQQILKKVEVSLAKHKSKHIFIVAHHDCKGNPVSDEKQKTQLTSAVAKIRDIYPSKKIEALWLDKSGGVHSVYKEQ